MHYIQFSKIKLLLKAKFTLIVNESIEVRVKIAEPLVLIDCHKVVVAIPAEIRMTLIEEGSRVIDNDIRQREYFGFR